VRLRADMLVTEERRQYAQITIDSIDVWTHEAHRRLRQMRANLACIERPDVLLREALKRE
jgi:predicted GNAT family N-acyltransferase